MMKLWLKFCLVVCAIVCISASVIKYDQKQHGSFNVRLDLKNIHVFAAVDSDFIDDYANYDYAYDYADFTIKPPKPTSTPPSSPESSSTSMKPTTISRETDIPKDELSTEKSTTKLNSSTEDGKIDVV